MNSQDNLYGKRVNYDIGKQIQYRDFTIHFLGIRHETPDVFPIGWDVFDVSNSGDSILVSWSAGTGLIGPETFMLDGKSYVLELKVTGSKHLSQNHRLKDNEMIIWEAETYRNELKK